MAPVSGSSSGLIPASKGKNSDEIPSWALNLTGYFEVVEEGTRECKDKERGKRVRKLLKMRCLLCKHGNRSKKSSFGKLHAKSGYELVGYSSANFTRHLMVRNINLVDI